jgi:hypothetical protein
MLCWTPKSLLEHNYFFFIAALISITVAGISFMGSFLVCYLIRAIKRNNGYLRLVSVMATLDCFYNLSYFTQLSVGHEKMYQATIFLTIFCGLSVTILTNILITTVYNIVHRMEAEDIQKYFHMYFLFALGIPFVLAVYGMENFSRRYGDSICAVRLSCIVYNIIIYYLIIKRLKRIDSNRSQCLTNAPTDVDEQIDMNQNQLNENSLNSSGNSSIKLKVNSRLYNSVNRPTLQPVYALTSRIWHYPLWQVLTRIPATYYELEYGYKPANYVTHDSVWAKTWLMAACIIAPASGIGFLVIFLQMQPIARRYFYSLVHKYCPCCWYCCHEDITVKNQFDNENNNKNDIESDHNHDSNDDIMPLMGKLHNSFDQMVRKNDHLLIGEIFLDLRLTQHDFCSIMPLKAIF